MKQLVTLILILNFTTTAKSQDSIFVNGKPPVIIAEVLDESDSEIYIKKGGKEYSIPTVVIHKIRFSDGIVKYYEEKVELNDTSMVSFDSGPTNLFVNGIPLDSLNVKYLEIIGTSVPFTNRVVIDLDFGQFTQWISLNSNKDRVSLTNPNGTRFQFNSMVGALNYFAGKNYELKSTYVVTVGNQNVIHWLIENLNYTSNE